MSSAIPAPEFRLDGRVAVVTGAGRGIGQAAATALAGAGAHVVLVSRTAAELQALAATIVDRGGSAEELPCDVTDTEAVRAAFAGLPRLDILVNNAGTNMPGPFTDVTEHAVDVLLNLNVRAAFFVAQAGVRKMLEHPRDLVQGVVINVSSQMGHVGAVNRTVYCMTKHAIEGLTKAMAVELAPRGIRVNAIAPTFIETAMTAPELAKAPFREWTLPRIPLGRLGVLDDLTGAFVFLASPAAALMTGTSLIIDGGWTAQ